MNRTEMLAQLNNTNEWDIVIIGGGATGLGSAVDAASRGYKTLLIEQYDFAKGTSSRATKLVHGGVRYLAQGNLKLVMEALRERGYLLRNAPHVTSTLAFVVPVYTWFDKYFYGVGLKMYNVLAGKLSLGRTRLLNRKKTIEHLTGINSKNLKGGILYYDGQFDDARLAIDLAMTAQKFGASVLNYCKASSLIKTKNKITGLAIEDVLNKKKHEVKAKVIINATGVFADNIMLMDEPEEDKVVAPSQGIHLVVDKKFFPGNNALMIPKTDDKRVLFAVPWHNEVILGTTDTPISKISVEPKPLEEEIEFVLHHANRYLEQNITREDVKSMFAGLRPLVKKKGAKKTSLLNRDHTIIVSKSGLVTITGGKWTTYRKMAEDAIDNAVFVAKLPKRECVTRTLTIVDPNEPLDLIHSLFQLTKKNIEYFVQNEMAMTVEDILARRTRLLFLDAHKAIEVASFVTETMAEIMHKDDLWKEEQVHDFTALAKQYVLIESDE